jgi:hypothetical protein
VEGLLGEEAARKARIPSIDSTHLTLVVSEIEAVPAGFQSVEGRALVSLTRADDPVVEPL